MQLHFILSGGVESLEALALRLIGGYDEGCHEARDMSTPVPLSAPHLSLHARTLAPAIGVGSAPRASGT